MTLDDNDMVPLAHSPPRNGEQGDPYARHVEAVRCGALERAQDMLRYGTNAPHGLLRAVEAAATFHDLGKLDPDNQAVLRSGRKKRLSWDHIDAGVAHLTAGQNWMAAWMIRAHHAPGLPQKAEHFTEQTDRRLRGRRHDVMNQERHLEQIERTDSLLSRYMALHEAAVGMCDVERRRPIHGLTMRLALSCLVDADYSDSAAVDSGCGLVSVPETRWEERLRALEKYVRELPKGETVPECLRNEQRNVFFHTCLNSQFNDPVVACQGPVGLGKTTAVAAYLIRRACDEGLRRLIIVAPFTNILSQIAKRLRKAIVLPNEDADQVIVEHHHRADFSHRSDRELAVLWRAPIILTTAVSFFETLAACDPSTLRKLHQVPGSAIFLDEAHASLPIKLWPQNWKWVNELAEVWGCRFVLASGSLAKFWSCPEIIEDAKELPYLLTPSQAEEVLQGERNRVKYSMIAEGHVVAVDALIRVVEAVPGPRLIILNTVQNAAVVADAMRKKGMDVLHLSTALTPRDRSIVLARIEQKLESSEKRDWALVATSCVEAGLDLSFHSAFRERFSTASLIQVGGRVNRDGEYDETGGGSVYDFVLDGDGITQHPGANLSAEVLKGFLRQDVLSTAVPADAVTQAMREELRMCGGIQNDPLIKAESERDYPEVSKLGRVIAAETRFVVVDTQLKDMLRRKISVKFSELLQGSVQIWATKIEKLRLQTLTNDRGGSSDVYSWDYDYDPDFLGYMDGVLKLREFISAGGTVI